MPFTFRIGAFDFQDFEIPEEVGLGGEQMVAVHKFVGGDRVVDMLGRDDAPVTWSGRFRGADAVDRCLQVDAMRIGGLSHELVIGPFRRTVVVQRFEYRPQKLYEIPYTISCLVVTDDSVPLDPSQGPTVDDMMASDSADATIAATAVGNTGLTGAIGGVQSAIGQVASFVQATRAQINSVLTPITAAQATLSSLIASTEATVTDITTLGGILPGNPAATNVANFLNQAQVFSQLPHLYDIQGLLGRMTTNLNALQANGSRVVQAGGDLYHMAAKAYGTATEWPTIARANNMTDPQLSGVQTVVVPAASGNTDGLMTI